MKAAAERRSTIPGRSRLSLRTTFLWFILTTCACVLFACDRKPSSASQPDACVLRIVSLSPAISRTLVDLDLAQYIVGRSPYCSSLDQAIPVVGDLNTVDFEQLVRLNPTLIVVQPPAGGVDRHLREVATQHNWRIADWHLNGIEDIRRMVGELASVIGEMDASQRDAVQVKAEAFATDLADALTIDQQHPVYRGRVLMVNAVDPVMAFGVGTYLDDVLGALGGVNAIADKGWVQLSMEDVVRLKPEAIILVKPRANRDGLARDLGPLAVIDAPAVALRRFDMIAHPDSFLPSTSVVGVAEELRAILQRFAEDDATSDNRP